MNNDLISRSALLADYEDFKNMDCPSGHTVTADYMIELAEDAHAVDAEPVRRGRWVETKYGFYCSYCKKMPGRHQTKPGADLSEYCHRCGAKMMDGDVNG